MRGLSTKPAAVGSDMVYLGKAREFLDGARYLADRAQWNSSAVLSVHAVISACDAVCTRFLQLRHAGAEHMQAIRLLRKRPLEKGEIEAKMKQGGRVLTMKNAAEYEDRLIRQKEALGMLRDAERVVSWAGEKLG